jgi:hypothetical protein
MGHAEWNGAWCPVKIKQYRRIFARFDKLDTRYFGFL